MGRFKQSKFSVLRAFVRLVRFGNLLMIGFTQYLVKIFFIDSPAESVWEHFTDFRFFMLSSSTVLIAAAGYIINDYYDVKIDLLNKPDRVVVGSVIQRRMALLFNFLLNALAMLISFWLSWKIAVINFFCIFLLWWYSNLLKRLPFVGNFAIALLTGATVWIVAFYYNQHYEEIYIYASFAFFITLVREVIKDMEDVKGDEAFGCKTLPIIWGIPRTKIFVYALVMAFISNLAVSFFFLHDRIVVFLTSIIFLPIAWVIIRLYYADRRRHFRYLSCWVKFIMLLGLISIFFAKI
ncbi:geranylgeranylglycerol-phosphate geranylgeranyltransferase [Raineya orbicola]|jgi:4-hydroxybenzoate polyprenyltransferase|uniref:UbiA prenyltransferase family n=1 Tax=Raineya orbicola TaxID=2016530 RepID=A0A2N3IJI9_9BACT|nr:geranylgeranylglycerol-phosphate geranylgeranyltransferase [Raineya orbicola]PKQ70484.1 UbiA prenyltransferase family [Raineya orbicola]